MNRAELARKHQKPGICSIKNEQMQFIHKTSK